MNVQEDHVCLSPEAAQEISTEFDDYIYPSLDCPVGVCHIGRLEGQLNMTLKWNERWGFVLWSFGLWHIVVW
jgi:hypothetical protein